MKIAKISFTDRRPVPDLIELGYEDDHNAEALELETPQIAEGQTASLCMANRGKYADVLPVPEDGVVKLTRNITAHPGSYRCWLEISAADGEMVWHSGVFCVYVTALPDVEGEFEAADPTFITRMNAMADAIGRMDGEMVKSVNGVTPDEDGNVTVQGGGSGTSGEDGGYYKPDVAYDGTLTWTASKADMPAAESANIRGPAGPQGEPGQDGYTPVKGVDYFTDDEVAAITDAAAEKASSMVDVPVLIERVIAGYSLTTAQPEDWEDSWTAYYINTGTKVEPVYASVAGDAAPAWQTDTYYMRFDEALASLARTHTPNGERYNLTHLFIRVIAVENANKCSMTLNVSSATGWFSNLYNHLYDAKKYSAMEYYQKNGYWHQRRYTSIDGRSDVATLLSNASNAYVHPIQKYPSIVAFDISNATIPAGTIIEIMGVQKNA